MGQRLQIEVKSQLDGEESQSVTAGSKDAPLERNEWVKLVLTMVAEIKARAKGTWRKLTLEGLPNPVFTELALAF